MRKSLLLLVILLSVFGRPSLGQATDKPNVLFILVDDLGWNDVGFNGSSFYETPEIDKLSQEFMRFDRCYTPSPMCSPTRTSIMTGKNPARHGITQWLPGLGKWPYHEIHEQAVLCPAPKVQGISKDEVTLGEALQAAGYETGFYGKWHMGKLALTGGPKAHGFDSEVAVIEENSCAMFYPFREHPEYFPDARLGDNFTDLLTKSAIEFVSKKREKPFFLYLAHFAMHAPIKSKEEELAHFTKKREKLPKLTEEEGKVYDDYAHKPYKRRQDEPEYAGELKTLDENIGKLVQTLKDQGLYDNTIIIITGDNGGRSAFFAGPPTSVQPLRGGKTFTFDGGLRTPLLVHWPGVTHKNMHTDLMVTSTDFYPTILEMLGLPQRPEQHLDGISLVPLLKGEDIERKSLYFHFPHYQGEGSFPTSAICNGNYKLIVNYHQQDELLYDVYKDIGETNNLAKVNPKVVEKMKKELMNYLESAGAVIPQPNPDYESLQKKVLVPKQANNYLEIYQPDGDYFFGPDTKQLKEGEWYDRWIPNDHCFVKHSDGLWHIFGITHPYTDPKLGNIHQGEYASFHAVSTVSDFKSTLEADHYIDKAKVLPPRGRPGEINANHAPYIIKKEGLYYMVYGHSPIRLATSADLYEWTPRGTLFEEEKGARDPNLILHEGTYYMTYCSEKCVRMRTSKDLFQWSEARTVLTTNNFDPESPSIIYHNNTFYLFVCSWEKGQWDRVSLKGAYTHNAHVYASSDLTGFGTDKEKEITVLNAHAPEIFQGEDGQWYISSVVYPNFGVHVDKLWWE